MSFTGADPRYLSELEVRKDFLPVRDWCSTIGAARRSSQLLSWRWGEKRGYETARPDQEGGLVEGVPVEGGLDDHARAVAEKIASSLNAGIPAHEIAVLYPARGSLPEQR